MGVRQTDAVSVLHEVEDSQPLLGRKVVIYGGGNTAIDVARTAKRLGAEESIIVYRRTRDKMPAHDFEVKEALHNFALALTIGIMFGIYSSVLVAAPLLLMFGLKREHMIPQESEKIEGMNADGSVV